METRRFLVIDDDEDDRRWLMEAIEKIVPSSLFTEANNGKEGLKKLDDGFRPDMVFVDLNMPVMNGLDFLSARLANKSMQDIPVVVISTSSNPATIDEIEKMGVDRYIVKPTTEKAMFAEVITVLARREFTAKSDWENVNHRIRS